MFERLPTTNSDRILTLRLGSLYTPYPNALSRLTTAQPQPTNRTFHCSSVSHCRSPRINTQCQLDSNGGTQPQIEADHAAGQRDCNHVAEFVYNLQANKNI